MFRVNRKEKRKKAVDRERFRAKESLRNLRAISGQSILFDENYLLCPFGLYRTRSVSFHHLFSSSHLQNILSQRASSLFWTGCN